MKKELKAALSSAKSAYKKKDDVGLVSWLTVATGFFPEANESDEAYEAVFNRLSEVVTTGSR